MILPITEEQKERIAGKTVVASVSGGKDSTALSLWLLENGIDHHRVYANVGWDTPETLDYIRGPLSQKLGAIVEVFPERQMVDLIRNKGMFPSKMMRYCTQHLKVNPISKYLQGLWESGLETVNPVGVRAEESAARAKLPEWELSREFWIVWRPLLTWTLDDVIEIHRRNGLAPNPMYTRDASGSVQRVGCAPCIYARKSEIRYIAENYPERIDIIRQLEKEVGESVLARFAAQGKEWTQKHTPTFFQVDREGAGFMPIDEVVEWSKTSRGGRQYELFASDNPDAGCMRWGLCEHDNKDEAPHD